MCFKAEGEMREEALENTQEYQEINQRNLFKGMAGVNVKE